MNLPLWTGRILYNSFSFFAKMDFSLDNFIALVYAWLLLGISPTDGTIAFMSFVRTKVSIVKIYEGTFPHVFLG